VANTSPIMPTPDVPGRQWYFVAPIFVIAGIAAMAFMLYRGLDELRTSLTQIVVPGSAELNLGQPGTYTIFHEYQSVVGTRVFNVEPIDNLFVSVRDKATGREIALETSNASSRYSFNGRSGRSILTFAIAAPGTYLLEAHYGSGRTEPQTVLTVGYGFVGALLKLIGAALATVSSGIALTVGIIIFVSRRRQRAKIAGIP
jgi:hypothetical protein